MLFKATKEQKEMFDSLRKMKTLKVNDEGCISVDPREVINRTEFKETVRNCQKKSQIYSC